MHLDHDHMELSEEHTHEHSHTHSHTHTHDGVEHTHEHTHTHTHEHTHEHGHDHDHPGHDHEPHEHTHDHCDGHDCTACVGCGTHDGMEELKALMKYMVGHNAAHANELANLAKQLDDAGQHTAFEQVMMAVCDFEKGNLRLSTVLQSLN